MTGAKNTPQDDPAPEDITSENTDQQGTAGGTISRYQSMALLASSVLTALATLGVTIIAHRSLLETHLTEFLLFWSALFAVTGIITGIQPEVTRAVGAARRDGIYRVRVVYVAGAFGLLAGILVVLTSPLWAPKQMPISMRWVLWPPVCSSMPSKRR